jgi:iron(III) transport system substrate-binding protein
MVRPLRNMPAPGRHLAYLAVLLFVVATAACGGSSSEPAQSQSQGTTLEDVVATVAGLTGDARAARLAELADAEGGTLDFYTSMSPSLLQPVVDAFEATYDVDVAVYRANSSTVLQRLVEELDAGFHGSDVVESSGPEMVALAREGGFTAYESPARTDLVEGATEESWTVDRVNLFVVARNTELVRADAAPRSWKDLADPRWAGKLAIEAEDSDWFEGLWDYLTQDQAMSEQEAEKLLSAIGTNAHIVRGHTVLAQLMGAGEFDIGVNYRHTTAGVARDGAPLDYEPSVAPLIARPNGVGVSAEPVHPATAMLFVDWLLGPGQEVLLENDADPVRSDLQEKISNEERFPVDLEEFVDHEQEWTERFERLIIAGKEPEEG